MGNQLAGIAPSQIFPVEYYLTDLPDFSYNTSLGSTRFFKVALAKHKEGLTVIKVFVIHDPSLPLNCHKNRLEEIRRLLSPVPHCLPFQKFMLTDKAGFLVRQFVKDNLYDKISTRPFLNKIEKLWIAFQLLQCLNQCHKLGVCHGDIKLENIMVTSWNWVLLTDFASFKPTYLPEDNPADFSYFFDTSRRRTCYIAPERFIKTLISEVDKGSSAVCSLDKSSATSGLVERNTIANSSDKESSASSLTLSDTDMVKGKQASSGDMVSLSLEVEQSNSSSSSVALPDAEIKKGDLMPAMDIFSLGCALTELFTEGNAPFDFSQLLSYHSGDHKYNPWKVLEKIDDFHIQELVRSMMQIEPTQRLHIDEYLEQQRNKAFPEYFYTFLEDYMKAFASVPILSPDEKIHRLRNDINMIIDAIAACEKQNNMNISDNAESKFSEGLVLIVPLLTSSLRALKHCTAKLNALEVLRIMASHLSPEIILDRLLPYMVYLARDRDPKVRVAVIQTLTECLTLVKSIPRSDSNIFPEYILPNLLHIAHDDAVIVRMAYAKNIALLAETALRYLEMTQIDIDHDPDNSCSLDTERSPHSQVSYDHELQTLQELIQQSVTTLLSDPVNAVKQTLLDQGIKRLCGFFGRQKGNDVLLSHMITYLNDKEDRHLRASFFDSIVGVASYVGWQCCPILKPLLQQGLADSEEFVISKALHALSDLTELRLMQKQMLYDLVSEAIPLLSHPNLWIKQGAVGFVCAVARCLNLADIQCRLMPQLHTFLKHPIIQVEQEIVLLNAVKDPLSRCLYDYLVKLPVLDTFLQSLSERKILRSIARPGHPPAYREMDVHLSAIYRRLQSDGMTEAIEDQILAMKDHLLKIHAKKSVAESYTSLSEKDDGIIDISNTLPLPKMHSLPLTSIDFNITNHSKVSQKKNVNKKKGTTVESPTVTMNQEWQHMFGSADQKSPPSPRPQHYSDGSLPHTKLTSVGKEGIKTDVTVLEQNTAVYIGEKDNVYSIEKIKPIDPCVPCKEELSSLIRKKQKEWTDDEIVREASEVNFKEDKLSHKQVTRIPSGSLVAHLHEHRRAVNRVQVIPDSSLFATCSSDCTVKIWDCEKMEGKNIANRSKLTYSRLEGPVSCLTVCQNMQSLAAASDNGNIHVFRISSESTKSPILHTRVLDPQEEGCAVDLNYFDTGSQSVLVYATVYGSIVGWDLRSPGTAWKFESDPKLGLVTSFCTDPHHCWLALGTANGNISCWDLRFQLPITTVSHPAGARIRQLLLHPKQQSAVLASVQGNNEVSLWDVETQARLLTLWASTAPPLSQTQASEHSVCSMCWSLKENGLALLTGGSDMRIRYWDLNSPSESFIAVTAANDSLTPSLMNYRSRLIDGTEVIQEIHARSRPSANEDPPRRYPEIPSSGHHDCISGIATIQTSQSMIISASRDGVVKVWK